MWKRSCGSGCRRSERCRIRIARGTRGL
jgi:hypothetical protein